MCSAIFHNLIRTVDAGFSMHRIGFRHVILDRDGVLNRELECGCHVRYPSEFHWLPGALEGIAILRRAGLRLSVTTNQSGVGRGLMSLEQLAAVHARMQADASARGGELDAVLFCPHAPEDQCPCRKPAPGLIHAAIARSGIARSQSIVVGDDQRDLEAARRAGVAAALVRTGKGRRTEELIVSTSVRAYDDLPQLARAIVETASLRGTAREQVMSIQEVFAEHSAVAARAAQELPQVLERIVRAAHACLCSGHKILACGNGGSAAEAQHLVAELVGRFREERRALPAIALTADTATLTAIGNDYGYQRVFARQVEALARPGDLLFAISTSGDSPNVVLAAQAARGIGCCVVALTGAHDGQLATHAEYLLQAPSTVVARIQEVHTICIHAFCESLDSLIGEQAAT